MYKQQISQLNYLLRFGQNDLKVGHLLLMHKQQISLVQNQVCPRIGKYLYCCSINLLSGLPVMYLFSHFEKITNQLNFIRSLHQHNKISWVLKASLQSSWLTGRKHLYCTYFFFFHIENLLIFKSAVIHCEEIESLMRK